MMAITTKSSISVKASRRRQGAEKKLTTHLQEKKGSKEEVRLLLGEAFFPHIAGATGQAEVA